MDTLNILSKQALKYWIPCWIPCLIPSQHCDGEYHIATEMDQINSKIKHEFSNITE
ncbi:hypothetical protein DPMN_161601 [Dreissena polymorpha]|uniref:Uncharacterized protein n=1 Tax=Dreissena polymorpha TaxID=45954 RepID=A0A9D4EQQ5_DREPO|nr:hypothetical protein DPMN_161601 [Dreissena polymorpha]